MTVANADGSSGGQQRSMIRRGRTPTVVRWGAAGVAALVIAVGLRLTVFAGTPGVVDGIRLGEAVACPGPMPIESGASITCDGLTRCASTALWGASPPGVTTARVYRTPVLDPGQVATSAGWIVVFDLAEGGQRATRIGLVPECPL